jgi:hypothetical protein
LVAGEHVPDRLGESAGEVDLGDLGAALFAGSGLDASESGSADVWHGPTKASCSRVFVSRFVPSPI